MPEIEDNRLWIDAVTQAIRKQSRGSSGLIDDVDHILSNDISVALTDEGWEVVFASSPLALRFEYETRRARAASEQATLAVYVLGFAISGIPCDVQHACPVVRLSLRQFFPTLSHRVMRGLPPKWYARTYAAQQRLGVTRTSLDESETAQYILHTCLGINLSAQSDLGELLELMADLALYDLIIPRPLQDFVWPAGRNLELQAFHHLFESTQSIRAFLQAVWQAFADNLHPNSRLAETYDSVIVRSAAYLESRRSLWTKFSALLAANILMPVTLPAVGLPSWLRAGTHYVQDQSTAVAQSLEQSSNQIPNSASQWLDWVNFAYHWAAQRLAYFQLAQPSPALTSLFESIHQRLENEFLEWLIKHYSVLMQQPYLPQPSMVHQVAHYVAATYRPTPQHPIAIVVVDGMAIEDWLIVQSTWKNNGLNWQVNSRGMLALIPTLTSVSRQALLSGKLPRYFERDWLNTQRESVHWHIFWEEHGLVPDNIGYLRGLGRLASSVGQAVLEPQVEEALSRPAVAASAFIINIVDDLVHGATMGVAALHQQVQWWAGRHRYLQILVARLLEKMDTVIVTSDHGHVEGYGIGQWSMSALAEERALRAQITNVSHGTTTLPTDQVMRWPTTGLPDAVQVYLPKELGLFMTPGQVGISHGGAALEEVVVPFVTITR